MTVIETAVACHLSTKERWSVEGLVFGIELHLSHHLSLVVAIKLIHLKGVLMVVDEITGLVDDARFTEFEELLCLLYRYLLLKLITAHPLGIRRTFDGEVTTAVTQSHPDGASVTAADISLFDTAIEESQLLIAVIFHQELAFYL